MCVACRMSKSLPVCEDTSVTSNTTGSEQYTIESTVNRSCCSHIDVHALATWVSAKTVKHEQRLDAPTLKHKVS